MMDVFHPDMAMAEQFDGGQEREVAEPVRDDGADLVMAARLAGA